MRTSCSVEPVQKTTVSFLSPDFGTINQQLLYVQKLAEEVNMLYVNVTLDVELQSVPINCVGIILKGSKMSSLIWVTFISSKIILMSLGK